MRDIKTFLVISETNYGEKVMVVNSTTPEEASKIATDNGAWEGAEVVEINTETPGIVYTPWE